MKGNQFMALMAALIIGLLLLVLFEGCYSPKKAEKAVSKALAYYPEQTIGKVRILAPCVTSGSSVYFDSTEFKNSMNDLETMQSEYDKLLKTGPYVLQPGDSLCPELKKALEAANQEINYQEQYIIDITDQVNHIKPIIVNHYDTTEDLAKVMEMDFKLLAQQKLYREQTAELSNVKQERDKSKAASNKKTWWIAGEGVGILLLLVLLYFILKGKSKL